MLLYTNGCSHSDDHPTLKESYVWPNQLMSGFTKSFNYYHNQSILPLTLSEIKALDNDFLVNDARSGIGNDKIFHQSMESICKLMGTGKKPDFVIIQWSGPNRREHCLMDEKPVYVTLYDNTEYHLKYEPMGSMHTIHYVYCLQQFLMNHDIPYYFFNYIFGRKVCHCPYKAQEHRGVVRERHTPRGRLCGCRRRQFWPRLHWNRGT